MICLKINKQLLYIKISFFLIFASAGPFIGFLPTIAKQFGYSLSTYGVTMTVVSAIITVLLPLFGIVLDKFRVKKIMFMTAILATMVLSFLFMFVPKVPLDTSVELKCDTETVVTIYANSDPQTMSSKLNLIRQSNDESVACKLDCPDINFYNKTMNELNDQSDSCYDWMNSDIKREKKYDQFNVTLDLNDAKLINDSLVFNVQSFQTNGSQVFSTICNHCNIKTHCYVKCSNDAIMDAASVKTYRGNVLSLYQFWIFFILIILNTTFSATSTTIINTVCLDSLEKKTKDYGKQKCWGSIGWGVFSIFIGWLVDWFSDNKKEKDYSPVFYSSIVLSLLNFVTATKIKIIETNNSKNNWSRVYKLLNKHNVIAFYFWVVFSTFFNTIITHFLFWYMEDLVSENNDPSQRVWIKTIQGLAQGIQCFGGEIPFFFWSGWIIKKLNHVHCMALVMGAIAVRMYFYSIISNPFWILLIEMLNGVSFALGFSVKMSYAKMISPPDITYTVICLVGFFDLIGDALGSLVGGYLFDAYGGAWSFRFFAYSSAFLCCLNIIGNHFGVTKEKKSSNFNAEPTKIDPAVELNVAVSK